MTVTIMDEIVPEISSEGINAKNLEEELENLSIGSGESYESEIDGESVDDGLNSITSQSLSEDESSTRSNSYSRENSEHRCENGQVTAGSNLLSDVVPQDLCSSSSTEKNDDKANNKHVNFHEYSSNVDEENDDIEKYNDDDQLDFQRVCTYEYENEDEYEDEPPISKPRNDLINTLAIIFSKTDVKDIMKWENRVQNEFYYRDSYIPVPREQREMEEFVGTVAPDKKSIKQDEAIYKYLFPAKDDPKSIVLKREHVTISDQAFTEVKELILLNHCLVILGLNINFPMDDDEDMPIANGSPKCKGKFSKKRLKTSANLYETCHPLSSIVSIDDNDMEFGDVIPLPSFGLKIIDDKNEIVNYKIHCFSLDFKASWISALRTSVTNNIGVDEDSVYASVLCNDLTIIEQKMAMFKRNGEEKDLIDKVNGYSPLHLAILTSKHLIANQLLRAGANPNTVAKDGSSPLSTAKTLKNELMIDMLEHHNAKDLILSRMSTNHDAQNRSKLFAGAKTLSDSSDKTNGTNEDATVEDAINTYGRPNKHLPALMAMASLQERGEKLNQIELKSSKLKDAAQNYGDMAKMMREEMEKKKKKRFFFF